MYVDRVQLKSLGSIEVPYVRISYTDIPESLSTTEVHTCTYTVHVS